MPFVRVSYREGQYDALQLEGISGEIQRALVEQFNVPEEDFFQVFQGHKASEFYYSPSYMDIKRTDGLLFIQITLKSGRSTAQKKHFYSSLAERLSERVAIRTEDVFVVLVDTEFEDWTFGKGIAQMIGPEGADR